MALEMLPFRTQPLSLSLNFISVGSKQITISDGSDGASGTSRWCPVVPQGQLSTSCKPRLSMLDRLTSLSEVLADVNTQSKDKNPCRSCSGKKEYQFLQAAVQHLPYTSHTLQTSGWKFRPGPPLTCHCTWHVPPGDQLTASRKQEKAMLAFLRSSSLV